MRKFVIGFVSLCAVLGAYLLYNRISSSPSIDIDRQVNILESTADTNTVGFDSQIGKIGDVGVGPATMAYYVKLDENKQVVQEWGFEKLLNEAKDIWDVEKPYTNIYRRNFKCYITADKGKVQVETAVGRTTPKDATFTSNVVVRILSGPSDDVKESFLYLDNFVFLSERSRLSTAGSVKFVSEDIRMDGTGLVLTYNEQSERLEYFEINDLDTLYVMGSSAAMFSTVNASDKESQAKTQPHAKPSIADKAPSTEASTTDVQPQDEQEEGVYYKCTFRKNVLVNTPEELIFAGNKLCINDIFWSNSSSDEPVEDDAETTNEDKIVAETNEPDLQTDDNVIEPEVTTAKPVEPNMPTDQLKNIVVTCDGGFVVLPKDSVRAQQDESEAENSISAIKPPIEFVNDTKKSKFLSRRIDYNRTTGDGIADGPVKLTYYVESTNGTDPNEEPVPVKITAKERASFSEISNKVIFEGDCLVTMQQSGLTEPRDVTFSAPEITVNLPEDKTKQPDMTAAGPAVLVFYMEDMNDPNTNTGPLPVTVNAHKQARFLAASNQIIFEGDSSCTTVREDPNALVTYVLLSEQITVDLPADSNEGLSGPAAGIKHLTAIGDVVRLAMTKTAKDSGTSAGQGKLLSGVELKCSRFDYDTVMEEFLATGPGVIKLNNSEVQKSNEPNEPAGRFSLNKPCWASIEGFDILRYFIRENRILADAGSDKKLRIDYLPIVEGRYDEHITAQTSAVEAILYKDPNDQTQLSTLSATGGIIYEDKDNEFIGSELFYDHKTAIVKVRGDESHPCYYNGALVDGIEMNEKTGKVKLESVEPGALQIKQ